MNAKIVVELLNDTNYERWGRDMVILMARKKLTLIVEGLGTYPASSSTTSSTSTTGAGSSSITSTSSSSRSTETLTKEQIKWKSRDAMAKALLASYMEPHFWHKYWSSETSSKMWHAVRKDQNQTGAEHFHQINDDIRSLLVANFPSVVNFNAKFKSLLVDLVFCDNEGHGMSDLEASYILLRALPTDDESWKTFCQIHASVDKSQQLMDDTLRHESRLKVEK